MPTLVNVREFRIPRGEEGTVSIVSSAGFLWFTEFRAIVRVSPAGQFAVIPLRSFEGDPGSLTVGPNGTLWANQATLPPPGAPAIFGAIFQITPKMHIVDRILPERAAGAPTNLVTIGNRMYTGLQEMAEIGGSDVFRNFVVGLNGDGRGGNIFHFSSDTLSGGWLNAVTSGEKLLWLNDYQGGVEHCTRQGRCGHVSVGYPAATVDSVHPMTMAYSPADKDVYVAYANTRSIYKISQDGHLLSKYTGGELVSGNDALAYYRGDIWITLGHDRQGRPLLGRLSPSGAFSQVVLSVSGPPTFVSAMTAGPDGRLWYLRANAVGEITSL